MANDLELKPLVHFFLILRFRPVVLSTGCRGSLAAKTALGRWGHVSLEVAGQEFVQVGACADQPHTALNQFL